MHITHLFDRYLNTTMNWVYHLIHEMDDVNTTIAAPIILENAFRTPDFQYLYNPIQWQRDAGEWSISPLQQRTAQVFFQIIPFYQAWAGKVLNPQKPDIFHAHFANVAWYYLPLIKRFHAPLVVSFYGYDYEQLPFRKPIFLKRYRELFERASVILCEGEHGKEILSQRGCPPEKILVLPLGIKPGKIPFHHRDKKTGRLRLLQAATFTEKKGHRYTLEAFLKALPHCPNMELTLVGEAQKTNIHQEVKQFIAQHNLEDKVFLKDFVPFKQFHDWLKDYDVFIQPSCYAADRDCEGGAPIVLLDAQATGLPIIATTHCDIPAEVLHEKTGLLAPERNVDQLARHIRTFYEMDELAYSGYSLAARQHVETHYNVQNSRQQLIEIYHKLLKN